MLPRENSRRSFAARDWLFALALLVVVFLVYQPAWQGGFLWDDGMHVTRPELRSWHGLYRIWFDVHATQQYYPLLHSMFWLEYQLWGAAPLGYHLFNILLHGAAALLVAVILRRLHVPGAYLAAAIFALHPIQVESVAWITEQKNTLSAVFYLSAMYVYLHFDATRKKLPYCGALALFILGLLSKTVTATLPAAVLLIIWWQRRRIAWRRDVVPLLPFFALGAVAGLFTAWVERTIIGAAGGVYELTAVERGLVAGRVVWFYFDKLLWPTNLMFMYPRWHVNAAVWQQYLYPAASLLALAILWHMRKRWPGPLVGVLFFIGTLFPVLGFLNVYPFVFSFVADHFQYLAGLGIIVLAAAGIALLTQRHRRVGYVVSLALLAALAALTWRQSRIYENLDTLYLSTIARNPECWLAENNLGNALLKRGQAEAAIPHFERTVQIKPDFAEAYYNLGNAWQQLGRPQEALAQYEKALSRRPDYADAHNNLGTLLLGQRKTAAAVAHFQAALKSRPDYADAHNNLGIILASHGRLDQAVGHFRQAVAAQPNNPTFRNNLAHAEADLAKSPRGKPLAETRTGKP